MEDKGPSQAHLRSIVFPKTENFVFATAVALAGKSGSSMLDKVEERLRVVNVDKRYGFACRWGE